MAQQVGFIGLGAMGLGMAQNILKAGFPLCVYNRTREKAAPILQQGGTWANSPTELAAQCDILVTMVSNDAALTEVTEGILRSPKRPSIHLSMSTVSPQLCTRLEKLHREQGVAFLAAPVTGRPERAQAGTLFVFLSGSAAAKQAAAPVLKTMSEKVFDLGDQPSQAALFKLCNNFMILSHIEAFSEATAVLEKAGISPSTAMDVWLNSLFDSPLLRAYAPMLTKRTFSEGGFALNLGLKDLRLLHTCADESQVPTPFLGNLLDKLLTSMNLGRANYDWSAILLLTRELSGLKP